jgi:hypothetical protein
VVDVGGPLEGRGATKGDWQQVAGLAVRKPPPFVVVGPWEGYLGSWVDPGLEGCAEGVRRGDPGTQRCPSLLLESSESTWSHPPA